MFIPAFIAARWTHPFPQFSIRIFLPQSLDWLETESDFTLNKSYHVYNSTRVKLFSPKHIYLNQGHKKNGFSSKESFHIYYIKWSKTFTPLPPNSNLCTRPCTALILSNVQFMYNEYIQRGHSRANFQKYLNYSV